MLFTLGASVMCGASESSRRHPSAHGFLGMSRVRQSPVRQCYATLSCAAQPLYGGGSGQWVAGGGTGGPQAGRSATVRVYEAAMEA
jgi:hypothetical protein